MGKDKKDNFVRIAETRTNKIINYIRLLGNLSNKSYYEYSNEDIDKVFAAIQTELDETRKRFDSTNSNKKKFRL